MEQTIMLPDGRIVKMIFGESAAEGLKGFGAISEKEGVKGSAIIGDASDLSDMLTNIILLKIESADGMSRSIAVSEQGGHDGNGFVILNHEVPNPEGGDPVAISGSVAMHNYYQAGVGVNADHNPNKVVMRVSPDGDTGSYEIHLRPGSTFKIIGLPYYETEADAIADGLEPYDVYIGADNGLKTILPSAEVIIAANSRKANISKQHKKQGGKKPVDWGIV